MCYYFARKSVTLSPRVYRQRVAVCWTKEFVALAGASLLPQLAGILLAVLPCLALQDDTRHREY